MFSIESLNDPHSLSVSSHCELVCFLFYLILFVRNPQIYAWGHLDLIIFMLRFSIQHRFKFELGMICIFAALNKIVMLNKKQ